MKIRNVKFSNCFLASGSLNFFGEGYWYDDWFKSLVPGFSAIDKVTFVTKTTTLNKRIGNMPLDYRFQPKELIPRCLKVYPFRGIILNAVGLSGPGAKTLFEADRWQKITKPFFISFMAVVDNREDRLEETKKFINLLHIYLREFNTQIGLQINLSCPNTKHSTKDLTADAIKILQLATALSIPLDLKVNTFIDVQTIKEIEREKLCDVLTVSNTIPYGSEGINWQQVLGQTSSPLAQYGGGGLSGKEILPLVLRKISDLRMTGISMPIKGSGGILSPNDVNRMKANGANAIEIGSVLILRPWRVKSIISRAEQIF